MKAIAGVWGFDLLKRLQKREAGLIRRFIWRSEANENKWNKEKLNGFLRLLEDLSFFLEGVIMII